MAHKWVLLFWIIIKTFFQDKPLAVGTQYSLYMFSCRRVFSTSKFTRASSHSFLPRYLQSTDGSKWLKEYLVCYVSPRIVFAKKLNCRYGRENQFYWLSEHLWKSNFQKQSKRINPVVLYFEFCFHMALFWSYA